MLITLKSKMKKNGFTLVELVISIFIIVSIGTIVLSIFTSTLRGNKKSVTINRVRENGNFAISQMIRNIQYSTVTSVCDSSESTSVSLKDPNGLPFSYSCDGAGNIASTSGAKTSLLLDSSSTTVVQDSCTFSCIDNGPYRPDQIKISFQLQDVSSGQFAEDKVFIPFSTTVSLRNYSQ